MHLVLDWCVWEKKIKIATVLILEAFLLKVIILTQGMYRRIPSVIWRNVNWQNTLCQLEPESWCVTVSVAIATWVSNTNLLALISTRISFTVWPVDMYYDSYPESYTAYQWSPDNPHKTLVCRMTDKDTTGAVCRPNRHALHVRTCPFSKLYISKLSNCINSCSVDAPGYSTKEQDVPVLNVAKDSCCPQNLLSFHTAKGSAPSMSTSTWSVVRYLAL